jgi:hypothetical protein
MSDLTAHILAVVARLKGETAPTPAAPTVADSPRAAMPTASPPDPAEIARVLGLPLAQLDRVIEVRVSWLPVTLWFVPGETDAEGLLADGVNRGRIWTAGELLDLLRIPDLTKVSARTVALAKLEFDGEITDVRRPAAAARTGGGTESLRGSGESS